MKWAIVKNAKKLKNATGEYKKIRIVPDQTPKERETYSKLMEELRQRTGNGEKDLYIRDGQIQKRNFSARNQNTPP